jgi:hypothetical protein
MGRGVASFQCGLIALLCCCSALAQGETSAAAASPQAPRIRILSPASDSEVREQTVTLQVAGASAGALRFAVNGREVQALPVRGAVLVQPPVPQPEPGEHVERVVVPIPPEDCQISVWAEVGAQRGEPARLRLMWAGRRQVPREQMPSLYLLAIGVGEVYSGGLRKLAFPAKDARDLVKVFKAQEGRLFRRVDERMLLEEQATPQNVRKGLDWLRRSATQSDVAVLFLAGHGVLDARTGGYYFAPPEWDVSNPDSTMISGALIQQTLRSIPGKVLVFLDTCHAGALTSELAVRGEADVSRFVQELITAGSGRVVFTAAGAGASSLEKKEWSNGAFTKAVVEGLGGRADPLRSGRITVSMLDVYVSDRVKELTGGQQAPTTDKHSDRGAMEDFPLSVSSPAPRQEPGCRACRKWWLWTGLGMGLAGGLLGGFGVSALAVSGQLIDPSPVPDRVYATTGIGAGLLTTGLVLIGGGAALLVIQARKRPWGSP